MSSIESKGQILQAFQHDARVAAEKHSDKFAGNSLGHADNSGIAATSFEKGAKWAFEFLRARSSPKAYADYNGQYESWAHEIMAESGIDDTLRDNMIPEKLDSVRSFVRAVVDSMINTSEGWRELYEREKAHSSQPTGQSYVDLVRKINVLNAGMTEHYQRHDYREMFALWRSIIEYLQPTNETVEQPANEGPVLDRSEFERSIWAYWNQTKPKVNMHSYLQGACAGYSVAKKLPAQTTFTKVEGETVGKILKSEREGLGYIPEEILDKTGISINYLDNLENDRIKNHSASVLWKLANFYKIDLKSLCIKAGIIVPKSESQPQGDTPGTKEENNAAKHANLPDDLLHWVRDAGDKYSHQKGDQDAYRAGATDMFWEHCHGVENPTRLSFVKFAYGCMRERDQLQAQLPVNEKELEEWKEWHRVAVARGKNAEENLDKKEKEAADYRKALGEFLEVWKAENKGSLRGAPKPVLAIKTLLDKYPSSK